mmetsp:Transcript_2407/g.2082  ORF Transcript_2407/g.2082 Transcript_2407/m.2082 type:complete len:174 (+) Transcript_2407:444-965(+)
MGFAIFPYAFNGYCISRMFQKEFLAKYKAKESSTEFKRFLNSLPEGVSIINDIKTQFRFINSRLKRILDVSSFLKANDKTENILLLKNEIDKEFDIAFAKMAATSLSVSDSQRFINKVLARFRVDKQHSKADLINTEEEENVDLDIFLSSEREKCLRNYSKKGRETKVSIVLA